MINRLIFTQDGFHEEITRKSDINTPILGYKSSEIVGVIATREIVSSLNEVIPKLSSKIDRKVFTRIIDRSFVVNELPRNGIPSSEKIDIEASVHWMDRENGLLNNKARLIEEEYSDDRVTSEQQRIDSDHYRQQSAIVLLMSDGTQLGTTISLQHSQTFLHWLAIRLHHSHKSQAIFNFDGSIVHRFQWTAYDIRKNLSMRRKWVSSYLLALGNGIIVTMAFLYTLSSAGGILIKSFDCPEYTIPIVFLSGMTLRLVPSVLPLWMFGLKGNLCSRLMKSELK